MQASKPAAQVEEETRPFIQLRPSIARLVLQASEPFPRGHNWVWRRDWQFLVTSDVMHSPDFKARFRGLKLPRRVADRLYRRNAEAMFPAAWNATPARPVASITSQRSVATAR